MKGLVFLIVLWSEALECGGKAAAFPSPSESGSSAAAVQSSAPFLRLSHAGVPYRLFVPDGYDAKKSWPLILFLHGGAGRGRDNERHLTEGNGMLAEMFARPRTAFVLAPQTESQHDAGKTLGVLDKVMATYAVDRTRVYVAGQSLGGYGALAVLSDSPGRFAGAVVIASGEAGDPKRLARVPIWFFHGEKDDVIDVAEPRRLVARIRRAGGTVKYTEYAGEEHGLAWLIVKERDVVPWLFAQGRKR